MFRIKDWYFDIEYSYLDAFIDEDNEFIIFGIKIKTKKNDNIGFEPKIDSEILLKIKPKIITKLQDISGINIEWEKFPKYGSKEPYMFLIIDEHEELFNTKIKFIKTDQKIIVKINAFCKMYINNEYKENLQIEIETEIDFIGIFCGNLKEEECINEIKPYMEINKYNRTKLDVSIMIPNELNMDKFNFVFGNDYILKNGIRTNGV